MKRLAKENLNTSSEYDRIYLERSQKPVDRQDIRRWIRLLKHYKGGKLIDLGVLDSQVPLLAIKKYPEDEIWGVDISPAVIANNIHKYPQVHWLLEDITKTKFPFEYFDYAVLGEVVEHLEYPEKAIKEAMRILKVGGTLALSTPLEEERELGAVDKDRHLWSFSVNDIVKMLKSYGRVKVEILGSQYFPTYQYNWPNIIAFLKKK